MSHFSPYSSTVSNGSTQGDGDSEICLVVEDNDMIETTMDGEPYMAGRFAATLRRSLYKGEYPCLVRALSPNRRSIT